MKTCHQILVLLLALTLGFSTACSSDQPNSRNNDSQQLSDTDSSDKDVENNDPKDINDEKDVDENDEKDTDSAGEDVENNDDDEDVENNDDEDVENNDDEDTDENDDEEDGDQTPLKDLTEEQILTLCTTDHDNVSNFFDPANDTGTAYCLLFAAYAAYEDGKDPAEIITACEDTMTSCTSDSGGSPTGICFNQHGCNATVADFERCSHDNIASFAAQTATLLGKTCSDYTTEENFQSLNLALDAYDSPQSCADLLDKCPQLYEL